MAKLIQSDPVKIPPDEAFAIMQEIESLDAALADHKAAVKDLKEQRASLWLRLREALAGQKTLDL